MGCGSGWVLSGFDHWEETGSRSGSDLREKSGSSYVYPEIFPYYSFCQGNSKKSLILEESENLMIRPDPDTTECWKLDTDPTSFKTRVRNRMRTKHPDQAGSGSATLRRSEEIEAIYTLVYFTINAIILFHRVNRKGFKIELYIWRKKNN